MVGVRNERQTHPTSASLDRPSAVLPIVALPRNRRTGAMGGELFFRNSSRESISSVYAIVIPVLPLFATSSSVQLAGIRSDTIIGNTSLRRACGATRELYSTGTNCSYQLALAALIVTAY